MKKIIVSAFSLYLVACGSFMFLESGDIFAAVDEDQLQVTLDVGSDITISAPSDCDLQPDLSGIADSTADCYAEWTITTGATLGFTAALTATSTSALNNAYVLKGNTNGDGLENYNWDSPGYSTTTEYTWSVDDQAEFGYKASTTVAAVADLNDIFNDSGSVCNSGTGMTDNVCWIAASSTSRTLLTRTTSAVSGTKLYIHFRAGKENHVLTQGAYTATTTITATTGS